MLKVTVISYSVRNDPCFLQRCGYPLDTLRFMGLVEWKYELNAKINKWSVYDPECEELAKSADIIIFQRPDFYITNFFLLTERLLKFNPDLAIITELDDFIANEFIGDEITTQFYKETFNHFPVIVSTPYLAQQVKHRSPLAKIFLYPTKIPLRDDLPIYMKPENPVIAYAGTNTHHADMDEVKDVLAYSLKRRPNLKIKFWGADPPSEIEDFNGRVINLPFITNYEEYLDAFFIEPMTIALNPLICSRKNWAKSAIKYLEYGQRATPALFSPSPEYKQWVLPELIVQPGQWQEKVDWLLDMPESQFLELGERMRTDVFENHTLTEDYVQIYLQILEDCREIQIGVR